MTEQRKYDAGEMASLEIGMQLKELLETAAGKWLLGRIVDAQAVLAKEAIMAPSKDVTLDYYRGRVSELAALMADIQECIGVMEELMAPPEPDEFDSYDGPQLGSGMPALGDFGR